MVEQLAEELRGRNVEVTTFHDDVSKSQNENLNRIVDFHNSKTRELDISVHFNAYEQVSKPMGTEVLYMTQPELAGQVSAAIASVGFINRGPKKRTDLFFLNHTAMPSILIEVCFVDSVSDADVYNSEFMEICQAVAGVLAGVPVYVPPSKPSPQPDTSFNATGKVSYFGGPKDTGVSPDEGLAFIHDKMDAPHLFLPYQPANTTGLARRLNPFVHYIACRWDYDVTPREALLQQVALVRNTKTGMALTAFPADWGPNEKTGRIADISPGLLNDLDLETDDEVEVIWPFTEDQVLSALLTYRVILHCVDRQDARRL